GHRGCATSFLATEAITNGIGIPRGTPDLDLTEACRLAQDGDVVALRVFADAGRALGLLIANVVNLVGVPVVILAGDGLDMHDHARPAMDEALADHLDPWATPPRIEIFHSDFDEWARGAAVVACQWLLVDPPGEDRFARAEHSHD
ncbi:ROK family protein, partial [Phytoactinopolyspora endophytica]|uniref:ROK family protein n=1 Tax=Phytoactinopolyspora endophytica TaxID=1642495 RepID=UPI0013E9FFD5